MAQGAGLLKTDKNGHGITSRWHPTTLARRIREINSLKNKFTFIETDAFNIIKKFQDDEETCFYIDPPYTVAARRLYTAY
jgi:DNA adenine methylase